ncbi:MAG: acyltransferase family protein [Rubripirellula sp.]
MSPAHDQRELKSDSGEVQPVVESRSERVLSIDALRGFDMFWIIGGSSVARALLESDDPESWSSRFAEQFEHVAWEGFRFYDLIFPLFIFLVGCVLPYSLRKYAASPKQVYGRIVRRGLLLVLLGFVVNGALQFDFANMRYAHVLQRIGIAYVFAAILYLHSSWRGQVAFAAGILLGYWALLAWVPAPGGVAGDYSMEGNLAGYLDRTYMPGIILEKYYGFGDNEGFLSTIPAIATALLGLLAGTWLQSPSRPWVKVFWLAVAGLASLFAGHVWGLSFPVIKNLWTSSFVLVAGGWSLLLLSLFYTIVDILGFHRLAFFWVVIGMNAITIYVGQRIVNFHDVAEFFFGGFAGLAGESAGLVLLVGILVVKWLLLWFLYRHRIFLRV